MKTLQQIGTKLGTEIKQDRDRLSNLESTKVDKIIGKGLSTEDYTTIEKSKLSGIEDGATADMTPSELLTAIKTVDGSGSGLDADLIDGMNAGSTNVGSTVVARDSSGNFSAGTITANLSGNASSATVLAASKTIGMTGDVSWTSASFNGSTNVSGTATLATVVDSGTGTFKKISIDTKGRVTGTTPVVQADITGLLGANSITNTMVFNIDWSKITTGKPTTIAGFGVSDAYTKTEIDGMLQGLKAKASVIVATTANITLSGTQTIDGVAVTAGQRVLVKNQTTASQNGIYVCSASAWSRSTDADTSTDIMSAYVFVEQGTANKDTAWVMNTDSVVLDTTSLTWVKFAGSGAYAATSHTHSAADITSGTLAVTVGGTGTTSSTGTGSVVLSTSPTLVTPNIGVATGTSFNGITALSSTTPNMDGVASIGTSTTVARADHTHASDSTKANLSGDTFTGPVTGVSFNNITALSSSNPLVAGTAAIGTSTTVARADHVHPAQTTITGNAGTATTLATGRTISLTGDVIYTSDTFNGSANVTGTATLATVTDSGTGTFKKITVDTKGRVTGTVAVAQSDITGLLGAGSITNTMLANSAVANLSGTNTGDETAASIKTKLGISTLSGSNTGDQTITLTGDVTGTGTGSFATTLADSGVTAGTYSKVTVDSKGRITVGSAMTMEDIPSASFKKSVAVATTANITLSGTQTIDGVAVVAEDRVLVKNQTTASQNGIYVVTASAWTRATDSDTSDEIASAIVNVDKGTTNGGQAFTNTFKVTDTLDTTTMSWYKIVYENGTWGISVTGNAGTATTLKTARTLQTDLGTTTAGSFNGSANITLGVTGTLPVANGGTGATTLTGLVKGNGTSAMTAAVAGTDYVIPSGSITGNAATATQLATARTISLTGDVTGSLSFDGSANASMTATIAANSVALGTDTTGNYVAGATAGTGISISGTAGEGWSPTIALATAGTAGTYTKVTTDAYGRVTTGTNPTTLSGYGITDAYTKTEIDTVNLFRADKFLAAQNIANMIYTNGDLTKIRYNTDTDSNYEVLNYASGNLSSINHYTGGVLRGTTTLSYTNGNLVSAVFA